MKYYIKPFLLLSIFISVIAMSCLKDKEYDNGSIQSVHATGGVPKVVEIRLTATNTTNFLSYSFDNSLNDTTVELIPVNLATAEPAQQDIHVTLTPDPDLVAAYNAANGTDYADPGSLYALADNGVVTIPKGSRLGFLKITFKPADFLGGNWAIGFMISKIDESGYTISGNLSTGVAAITIKNAYEGTYTSTGYLYHPSSPRPISDVKYLSTVDENTVAVSLGDLGGAGYIAWVTVDPVTNKLTITAAPGASGTPYTQFDAGLPTTNPGYTPQWSGSSQINNTYDPATQTFYLRYGYMGSTGWRVTEEILQKQ
jgi:Domain of unknown function (DUF1735)/Domain of unknown function (DUF4361)